MSVTTEQIMAMLREHHSGLQWAFLEQVPDGTGTTKCRTADALAMCLWPSKGYYLHGFEVKISRSDWQKEMQDPSKAHAFKRFCHQWWLVAPKGVAKLEELPLDWGWYAPTDAGRLRVLKSPTVLTPEPISVPMMASIMRLVHRQTGVTDKDLEAAKNEAYRTGFKDGRKTSNRAAAVEVELNTKMLERIQKSLDEFERRSGIKITEYTGGMIGDAVRFVLDHDITKLETLLDKMARDAQSVANRWRETANNLKEITAKRTDGQ